MTPRLFRAQRATDALLRGDPIIRRTTMRLPVNVPFIIDNLWEYLRPEHMPCRRHALFASPSPALALARATTGDAATLAVYEMVLTGPVKMAQIQVPDAKDHPDLKKIVSNLPKIIANLEAADRQAAAMLFLPGASKDDWSAMAVSSGAVAALIAEMASLSTFWASASDTPASHTGEVFFELQDGGSYVPRNLLHPG